MATHSSILARRIPWTEEPGGLYSPWGRISRQKRAHDATGLLAFHQLEPSKNQWLCVVITVRRGAEGGKADVTSLSSQHEHLQTHAPPWGWGCVRRESPHS